MANERDPKQRDAYVRQPRPRANQGTIDDVAQSPAAGASESDPITTHDSSFSVGNINPLKSRSYRKARSDQAKIRQELKYGQYLSVPKGNREIFASRERQAWQRRAIIGIVIVAIVVIVLLIAWPK